MQPDPEGAPTFERSARVLPKWDVRPAMVAATIDGMVEYLASLTDGDTGDVRVLAARTLTRVALLASSDEEIELCSAALGGAGDTWFMLERPAILAVDLGEHHTDEAVSAPIQLIQVRWIDPTMFDVLLFDLDSATAYMESWSTESDEHHAAILDRAGAGRFLAAVGVVLVGPHEA